MSVTRAENILRLVGTIFLCAAPIAAQTSATPAVPSKTGPAASTQKSVIAPPASQRPVILEASTSAPQVVTLLHSLSGLKMFRLLMRSGDVRAIASVDDSFKINGEVHTNVLAALALDDGATVAAWLPEVDAELGPTISVSAPRADGASASKRVSESAIVASQSLKRVLNRTLESPDITVIAQDRSRIAARYVGIDGVTGLSILKLVRSAANTQRLAEAKEVSIVAGQRVRVFGPEPATRGGNASGGPVYVRIGETEGQISNVLRGPSGAIIRLEMTSPRVSATNIGGVAINDLGETLGIVDTVKGSAATILPTTLIKSAAKRVIERQASVPRPWLGIRGEPLGAFPLEQLERHGWETEMARTLADRRGILLTSVAPGSPAFKAALKPGDVILTVNDDAVRTAEDFSWILEDAGPGGSLRFTVAKPEKVATEAVEVQLSESPDPFFNLRMPTLPAAPVAPLQGSPVTVYRYALTSKLVAEGLETVALKPRVAAKLGSSGGLLVIYVEPSSVASKAGLLAGDVIESINGQQVVENPNGAVITKTLRAIYTCNIVRNKQKMVLRLVTEEK